MKLFVGCFSTLYLVPAITVASCYIYEYVYLDIWLSNWQERVCRDEKLSTTWQIPCRQPGQFNPVQSRPEMWLYIVKYSAIFLTAMFSGTWIWCGKTLETWRQAYQKITSGESV